MKPQKGRTAEQIRKRTKETVYKNIGKTPQLKIYLKELTTGNVSLAFAGDLTIYSAGQLQQCLLKQINDNQSVHIILSKVNKIDTAGFQVLIYAGKWAQQNAKQIIFKKPSDAVKQITGLYKYNL